MVDSIDFTLEGSQKRNQRYVLSRFEKDGLHFEILPAPHDEKTLKTLKIISDKWLGARKEIGFSLGFFQEDYLQACDIAVVKNPENQIIAFANLLRDESDMKITIDLMRHDEDLSPNSTMDFMFIKLFLYAKEAGCRYFSLGMAPLSNVGIKPSSPIVEKLVHLIYRYGNRFYSFSGLRNYKEKYATKWVPHYISYSPHGWLVYNVIALLLVSNRTIENNDASF